MPPWPVYSPQTSDKIGKLVATGSVYDYAGRAPVSELEDEFAQLHGGRHVVSFNSGTSAMYAALCGLGVNQGDEVIVPNLTFLASASPALWLGATPVLVDSAPDDASVDPAAVERAITSRTSVVVVTHLFGNPVDLVAIRSICAERGVRLLEDCSHAHASTIGDAHVGTLGDAAIYSIGAAKLISGGHGGLLVTADPVVRDIALMIGHFKPRTRTDVLTEELLPYAEFALGGNLRLSPMAAILALDHLRTLESASRARCDNIAVLDQHLEDLLIPVRAPGPRTNKSHFDVVYSLPSDLPASDRQGLLRELQREGIPVAVPSTRPLNRVLRAMPSAPSRIANQMVSRLTDLVNLAPPDSGMPHSTGLHDRMISFPAGRLYQSDTSAADSLGVHAARVIRRFFEKTL